MVDELECVDRILKSTYIDDDDNDYLQKLHNKISFISSCEFIWGIVGMFKDAICLDAFAEDFSDFKIKGYTPSVETYLEIVQRKYRATINVIRTKKNNAPSFELNLSLPLTDEIIVVTFRQATDKKSIATTCFKYYTNIVKRGLPYSGGKNEELFDEWLTYVYQLYEIEGSND